MRKTIISTIILAGILSLPACKKNETQQDTPSLSGLSITEAVPYVAKGDNLVFKANVSSISTSNRSVPGTTGIYWQVNKANKDTLSRDISKGNPDFKYHVDSLGTYSVTCAIFAEGYYNSSSVTTFMAIDPATSLTGLASGESATIGGKQWMAMNLNNPASGVSYKNATVTDPIFGRLYTWEEASSACPAGWHLPSAEEWDAIGEDVSGLMAPAKFQDLDMWEPALGQSITNTSGFNALPVGYLDNTASVDKFRRHGEMAAFWTSSGAASDASMAQFRYILYDTPSIMKGNGSKTSLALSVRCVKD